MELNIHPNLKEIDLPWRLPKIIPERRKNRILGFIESAKMNTSTISSVWPVDTGKFFPIDDGGLLICLDRLDGRVPSMVSDSK